MLMESEFLGEVIFRIWYAPEYQPIISTLYFFFPKRNLLYFFSLYFLYFPVSEDNVQTEDGTATSTLEYFR